MFPIEAISKPASFTSEEAAIGPSASRDEGVAFSVLVAGSLRLVRGRRPPPPRRSPGWEPGLWPQPLHAQLKAASSLQPRPRYCLICAVDQPSVMRTANVWLPKMTGAPEPDPHTKPPELTPDPEYARSVILRQWYEASVRVAPTFALAHR